MFSSIKEIRKISEWAKHVQKCEKCGEAAKQALDVYNECDEQ